jgi:hypothetical protein
VVTAAGFALLAHPLKKSASSGARAHRQHRQFGNVLRLMFFCLLCAINEQMEDCCRDFGRSRGRLGAAGRRRWEFIISDWREQFAIPCGKTAHFPRLPQLLNACDGAWHDLC